MTTGSLGITAKTVPIAGGPNLYAMRGPTGRPMVVFEPDDNPAPASSGAAVEGSENPEDEVTPEPPKKKAEITLTSDKLKERLDKARGSAREDLLKELGVESVDAAREVLKKAKELEEAQLSEQERLKKRAEEAEKEAETLKQVILRNERDYKQEQGERALKDIAREAGVDMEEWDVVQTRLQKHIEANLSDEDEVNADSLKDFFEDLRKKKPVLFVAKEEAANSGSRDKKPAPKPNDNSSHKSVLDMTPEEYRDYKMSKGLSV